MINDVEKKHGTMDFKNKRDLYRFITSENVEINFNISFSGIE